MKLRTQKKRLARATETRRRTERRYCDSHMWCWWEARGLEFSFLSADLLDPYENDRMLAAGRGETYSYEWPEPERAVVNPNGFFLTACMGDDDGQATSG